MFWSFPAMCVLLFWNCWHSLLFLDLYPLSQQAILEGREDRTEMKWEKSSLRNGNWQYLGERIWWRRMRQRSYPCDEKDSFSWGLGRLEVAGQENLLEENTHKCRASSLRPRYWPPCEHVSPAASTSRMTPQQDACGGRGHPTYSVSTMLGPEMWGGPDT